MNEPVTLNERVYMNVIKICPGQWFNYLLAHLHEPRLTFSSHSPPRVNFTPPGEIHLEGWLHYNQVIVASARARHYRRQQRWRRKSAAEQHD